MILPSTLEASIVQFASCFTRPSFEVGRVMPGWVLKFIPPNDPLKAK
jgi:hypothetical protein